MALAQQLLAGDECLVAPATVPLLAVHGALHATHASFPVDSLIPDHQHQGLCAAEYSATTLHPGMVVHHPTIRGLVYRTVAALHTCGGRPPLPPQP